MKCSYCEEDSTGHVLLRIGEPEPDAPKGDKSRLDVVRVCRTHQADLLAFLAQGRIR